MLCAAYCEHHGRRAVLSQLATPPLCMAVLQGGWTHRWVGSRRPRRACRQGAWEGSRDQGGGGQACSARSCAACIRRRLGLLIPCGRASPQAPCSRAQPRPLTLRIRDRGGGGGQQQAVLAGTRTGVPQGALGHLFRPAGAGVALMYAASQHVPCCQHHKAQRLPWQLTSCCLTPAPPSGLALMTCPTPILNCSGLPRG